MSSLTMRLEDLMSENKENKIDSGLLLDLLKKEMMPAMGCTEPAAAALCGAKAHELAGEAEVIRLVVTASHGMVKNAMGVSIPSSEKKGLCSAVALGFAVGCSSDGLSLLSKLNDDQKKEAEGIRTELVIVQDVPSLYVSVRAECADGGYAVATISGAHDRFSHMEANGKVIADLPLESENGHGDSLSMLMDLTFDDVIGFADAIDESELGFIKEAVNTNVRISDFSAHEHFGLEVGKTMLEGIPEPVATLKDAFSKGAALAAAGSDARMGGCPMPVIINSGSGNQGITVTVPVKVVADYLKSSDDKTARAVCISEFIGLILTAHKTRLSALCGVFTAAIGTACAWVYLLGGDSVMMSRALNTMVGNLAGIICDGAKGTCALKIYSSLECASMSVRLALKGLSPGAESGIVGNRISETISNLSRLCNEGMRETDKTVVSIMTGKAR